MLTVLAWTVFVPATVWFVVFNGIMVNDVISDKGYKYLKNPRNWRDLVITWAMFLVPAWYLFGVY